MKLRPLIILCFLISLGFNIYLLTRESEPEEEDGPKEFSLYPDDFSSLDVPISYEPEFPVFNTFSSEGEEILFADFAMKGSIYESYERRYGSPISKQLVKNIQEIVYFLNGFKIRFREGDALTFFYDEKSGEVLYLRYKNSSARTVSEGVEDRTFPARASYGLAMPGPGAPCGTRPGPLPAAEGGKVPSAAMPDQAAGAVSEPQYWYFRISADRFLRNMVRAIVGTLIDVGRGKRGIADFAELVLPAQDSGIPSPDTPASAGIPSADSGEAIPTLRAKAPSATHELGQPSLFML